MNLGFLVLGLDLRGGSLWHLLSPILSNYLSLSLLLCKSVGKVELFVGDLTFLEGECVGRDDDGEMWHFVDTWRKGIGWI